MTIKYQLISRSTRQVVQKHETVHELYYACKKLVFPHDYEVCVNDNGFVAGVINCKAWLDSQRSLTGVQY